MSLTPFPRLFRANERDGILRSIRDPAAKRSVLVDFLPRGNDGELDARFDVVLGKTPPA